jgi:hypothetical protein
MRFLLVMVLLALVFSVAGTVGSVDTALASGPTVSNGWDAAAINAAGVRFKSFDNGGDREIYIGVPDLGDGANRNEVDAVWGASNHIKFEYTPGGSDNLKVTVDATSQKVLTYDLGDAGPLNYLQITVVDRQSGANVDFKNVTLNGHSLGDFTATGWNDWQVTGLDLTGGFVIEGDIELSGAQPKGEVNKVELKVGYVAPPPPSIGKVVVRVFLDANNDAKDEGESGLKDWEVTLVNPDGPNVTATTGPKGYASFRDIEIKEGYKVRISPPGGGSPVDSGWRLARSGPGLENASTGVYGKAKKRFVVGPAYEVELEDFVGRVNGNDEAWVRFSAIRVQRILVKNAEDGDNFQFYRGNQLVGEDKAGPKGFATLVAGGLFYNSEITVVSENSGKSATVTIPYGWQPKLDFTSDFN